jgi:cyclopropane fatty-acyl-phospholipid synthase-like methyltransferase
MSAPLDWYETFFHGIALDVWRRVMTPEQTQAEANFLEKEFAAPVGSRFLDVPCGNGRVAIELASRGYQMTGIDLSKEFLDEACLTSAKSRLRIDWILGDMRNIAGINIYDGAFCLGNSFGYLKHQDMEAFLETLSRALKPQARFILETGIAAEALLPHFKEREWYQFDDILFMLENYYRADVSCLETKMTFVRNGRSEVRETLHWVYTAGEIRRMLERAGFSILDMFESVESKPFTLGSQELFLIAEKRS